MEKTSILIVGGGPAGIQSSRMAKMLSPEKRVIVLRPEPFSVIYCAIPYAIERIIPMESIAKRDELVTEPGAELWRVKATSVDLDAHVVTVEDGRSIQYEQLLIVTGARPFIPPVPGHQLDNILTVKTAEDARRIAEKVTEAQQAVVIGAGAIGIEQALALRSHGISVTLVDMAPHPLPGMIDAEFGNEVIEWLQSAGITWKGKAGLSSFEGEKAVSAVVLEDGTRIPLEEGRDMVIVCVGVRPDLSLVENTDLGREKDGLIVNEKMQTTRPDVYAAGDCVHFVSGIDGKPIGGKLATNAVPMAKVAIKNMLGIPCSYPGFFNGAATCVSEWRVGGTGFTESVARQRGFQTVSGWGETTSRFPIMPGAEKIRVKLVADAGSGRILGGQVIGKEAVAERIDVITLAIQQGMTLAGLAQLSYSAQPWQTFFPARNAIVQAAEDGLKQLKKRRS